MQTNKQENQKNPKTHQTPDSCGMLQMEHLYIRYIAFMLKMPLRR